MASPPKPWERPGATPASSTTTLASPPTSSSVTAVTPSTSTALAGPLATPGTTDLTPPAIPDRPASLNAATTSAASTMYNRPGVSPYSSYGGYSSAYSSPYASPYSRLGAYGGYGAGMYGGYGGYGGMYGGMGGMMGGMPGDPNNPNSLTNQFSQSTQATFQLLEGMVGAFTGFAQMLESTYMTTHSSFFAMVAVAEQFSNLRNTLGNILGIFTLVRWMRTLFAKLTGRPLPADAASLNPSAFARFEGRKVPAPEGSAAPKPSRKPLFFFLAAAFGLPYLMNKVIKSLAASQEQRRGQAMAATFDPSKLEFCRVMWDYQPDAQAAQASQGLDLGVKKGDLVAVLSRSDPLGNASEWWRCRARDGRVGYVPAAYLEVVQRKPAPAAITAPPEAKVPTKEPQGPPPEVLTKPADITAESFVKNQFLS